MALFKFRKGGDEPVSAPSQAESVEAVRKRAKHRLIGASVLVLLGVIGFPLLFDTQPRPVAVDIPIEIPSRNKVRPLPVMPGPAVPGQAPASAAAGSEAPAAPASAPVPVEAAVAKVTEPASTARPEARPEVKPEPKAAKAEAKPADAKPAAAPTGTPDDGSRVQALLEGKAAQAEVASAVQGRAAPAAGEGRFVVQVGAFADATKARETRLRVEKAGLKTYTQVTETKDGRRIRVRVGPFASRVEADRAAHKIKGLDLPAAILTL